MQKQKGFTIIELIVVIAIIAVLATIVMINVTSYIAKGKDAAAKGNLATLLTNSAVWLETNSTFGSFLTTDVYNTTTACAGNALFTVPCEALRASGMSYVITAATNAVNQPTTGTAVDTRWCAQVTLKTGNTFCVDSTGAKVEKSGGTCAAATGATCL